MIDLAQYKFTLTFGYWHFKVNGWLSWALG